MYWVVNLRFVRQVSVFLKNQPGELAKLFNSIEEDIDVSAFEIAEAGDFGVIRIITVDSDRLIDKLEKINYTVSEVTVLSIDMDSVAEISTKLGENDINIEYAYSACNSDDKNKVIIKVDDPEAAGETIDID